MLTRPETILARFAKLGATKQTVEESIQTALVTGDKDYYNELDYQLALLEVLSTIEESKGQTELVIPSVPAFDDLNFTSRKQHSNFRRHYAMANHLLLPTYIIDCKGREESIELFDGEDKPEPGNIALEQVILMLNAGEFIWDLENADKLKPSIWEVRPWKPQRILLCEITAQDYVEHTKLKLRENIFSRHFRPEIWENSFVSSRGSYLMIGDRSNAFCMIPLMEFSDFKAHAEGILNGLLKMCATDTEIDTTFHPWNNYVFVFELVTEVEKEGRAVPNYSVARVQIVLDQEARFGPDVVNIISSYFYYSYTLNTCTMPRINESEGEDGIKLKDPFRSLQDQLEYLSILIEMANKTKEAG